MTATYPASIASFSTKVNVIDPIDASHPNLLQDEVIAIEGILGINPNISTTPSSGGTFNAASNPFLTVSARLANIETFNILKKLAIQEILLLLERRLLSLLF